MAAVIRKDSANRPEEDHLKGVDEAWEQYKLGKGKRITSDEELDAFIDSSLSMTRERKLQPYDLFFPDTVKDQLARVKKKDKTLCELLRKRFKKLHNIIPYLS